MRVRSAIVCALILGALALTGVSCRSRTDATATTEAPAPSATRPLQDVTMPDVARNPTIVQQQLRDEYAILEKKKAATTTPQSELAETYGRMGMLFMAAEYFEEAAACLANAETLAPSEMRWPYYLGHLYRRRGVPDKSAAAFERAVKANGNYAPALVHLGNAYLDQGRPEAAEPLYSTALAQQPRMIAALAGLGRAALARRDYNGAISYFEQALSIDPQATPIHYPLGLAYRGAGQIEQAQAHLEARAASGELKPPDPLLDDVDAALESAVAYEVRGARALDQGQWDTAVQLFRRGVELAPGEPSLRHKLGTALAMKGDGQGARAAFLETVRLTPSFAKAHYSLGLMYSADGQVARATDAFSAAVRYEPNYVEAHLQLAELLRHTGRPQPALLHFQKVLELDPRMADARYGYAMALVQTRRYRDARDRLTEGVSRHPDHPAFAVALARLLAAAPDDGVRDGRRALELVQSVPADTQRTLDWGLAMAMALAENGRYDEAAMWQRQAIGFASSDPRLTQRLNETLRGYEQRRPCRLPWSDAEPMDMVDRPLA